MGRTWRWSNVPIPQAHLFHLALGLALEWWSRLTDQLHQAGARGLGTLLAVGGAVWAAMGWTPPPQ